MFDLVSRERIRTQALDHQSPHVPKINGFSLNCVKMCGASIYIRCPIYRGLSYKQSLFNVMFLSPVHSC